MSKRPMIDLTALTSEAAAPMPEASQRTAPRPVSQIVHDETPSSLPARATPERVRTENLQALAFKVPPAFRKRFRQRAANADLKLNELLFAALDAWEEKHNL